MIIRVLVVNVPSVPFERLHKLSRSIIVRDIEPQTMRNSSWYTFTETEGVATNKICTFSVWFIESVEKERCGWAEKVLDMLLKCIDLFPSRIIGNLHQQHNIIIRIKLWQILTFQIKRVARNL